MDLTKDTTLIKKCLSADAVTLCNDGCQWRQGKNVVPATGTPLFTADFCHPA
jgi:hypothetical protein